MDVGAGALVAVGCGALAAGCVLVGDGAGALVAANRGALAAIFALLGAAGADGADAGVAHAASKLITITEMVNRNIFFMGTSFPNSNFASRDKKTATRPSGVT
jgi:hypothetical protein